MKCPSSEELASLYDGNLPKKHADPLRTHLAHCPRCAQDFKILHDSLNRLGAAPSPPPRLINLIQESRWALRTANSPGTRRGRTATKKPVPRARK